MHVSLFSWQNQLLAKGLLFMEEKVKLCEGKYGRKPVLEGSWALIFGQMRWFACLESVQPFLVLPWGATQPLGSPCEAEERVGCLNSHRATMFPPAMTASQKKECGSHVAAEPGLEQFWSGHGSCCKTAWNCLLPFISQCDLQLDVRTVLVSLSCFWELNYQSLCKYKEKSSPSGGNEILQERSWSHMDLCSNYGCRACGPRQVWCGELVTFSNCFKQSQQVFIQNQAALWFDPVF